VLLLVILFDWTSQVEQEQQHEHDSEKTPS